MNQGEHNGFNVCGWFVWFSADSGTQANPVNPVILSSTSYAYDHQGRMVWKVVSRRGAEAQSWEEEKAAK